MRESAATIKIPRYIVVGNTVQMLLYYRWGCMLHKKRLPFWLLLPTILPVMWISQSDCSFCMRYQSPQHSWYWLVECILYLGTKKLCTTTCQVYTQHTHIDSKRQWHWSLWCWSLHTVATSGMACNVVRHWVLFPLVQNIFLQHEVKFFIFLTTISN